MGLRACFCDTHSFSFACLRGSPGHGPVAVAVPGMRLCHSRGTTDAGASLGCFNWRHEELCPDRTWWGAPLPGVLLRTGWDAHPQPQAQVLVLRLSTGAGRCVFSVGDDQCTCTFVVVTQELELPLLGCTDCISLALLLILPYSAHITAFYKKLLFFVSVAAPCTSRFHSHVNTAL